ncbi:uncharacterized protein LOC135837964 [Planococcus citri]|uniref:uncharacterized protein LOC135837964 n=1 Tax=Planococcus citri TaxID=170843 RepID=UPI0031F92F0C
MLPKFSILCIIYTIWIASKTETISANAPEVKVSESELNDLRAKRDELAALKTTYTLEKQAWKNETQKLNEKVQDLEQESAFDKKRVWALMWFRWISMIKNEIEWRETVVTNFTFNEKLFEEEKSKNTIWVKPDEHRRQVWLYILRNCSDNPHIVSLLHEIEKAGIETEVFSKSIAFAYKDITAKLLSMMRWRSLPSFAKEPTFNTPITWSSEVNKCLLILMFDVDNNMVWDFDTELKMELATEVPLKQPKV